MAAKVASVVALGGASSTRQSQIQYYLQGSVLSANHGALVHRLKGLADNVSENETTFEDHEMVYILKSGSSNVTFRVRRSILSPDSLWQIRYLGSPEGVGDRSRAAAMRTCIKVATTDNVSLFLEEIGFRFDHELVLKGHLFKKGKMRISVSKIFRVPNRGDVIRIQPLTDSYLVELTATSGVQQDDLAEEMKAFAEHLKPYPYL
eukprot:gene6926-7704_t